MVSFEHILLEWLLFEELRYGLASVVRTLKAESEDPKFWAGNTFDVLKQEPIGIGIISFAKYYKKKSEKDEMTI